MIEIFTTPFCSRCERVKQLLRDEHIEYIEHDATKPQVVADLLMMQIFERTMPVIVYGRNPVRYISARDLPESDRELVAVLRFASSEARV